MKIVKTYGHEKKRPFPYGKDRFSEQSFSIIGGDMRADNAADFSAGELARRKKNRFLALFTASIYWRCEKCRGKFVKFQFDKLSFCLWQKPQTFKLKI